MSITYLEVQMTQNAAVTLDNGATFIFDNVIKQTPTIDYDPSTGIVTFLRPGVYVVMCMISPNALGSYPAIVTGIHSSALEDVIQLNSVQKSAQTNNSTIVNIAEWSDDDPNPTLFVTNDSGGNVRMSQLPTQGMLMIYSLQDEAGATGPMGATGSIGPTGADGVAGARGATGADGTAGARGATGATGAAGLAGAIGSTGAAGSIGPTGATGSAGEIGSTGATGLSGVFATSSTQVASQYPGSPFTSAPMTVLSYQVPRDLYVSAYFCRSGSPTEIGRWGVYLYVDNNLVFMKNTQFPANEGFYDEERLLPFFVKEGSMISIAHSTNGDPISYTDFTYYTISIHEVETL